MTDAAPQQNDTGPLQAHYEALLAACATNHVSAMQVDGGRLQAQSHAFIADLDVWLAVLAGRREHVLLAAAAREYQYALLAVVIGQYRQAFAALRLFLELVVSGVYYSAHELQLRRWLRGLRDNQWRRFTIKPGGVVSEPFVEAFCPDLKGELGQYRAILTKTYRECSEYVHGNHAASQSLPSTLTFNEETFRAWHDRADSARLSASFLLAMRYLPDLDESLRSKVEASLTDHLGHLSQIRAYFSDHTS